MSDEQMFKRLDEMERVYAPEELSPDDPEQARVRAEEGSDLTAPTLLEPPDAAPVASVGSSPSGSAAPPNIGHNDEGGAPGAPNTQAGDPLGS